MKKIYLALVFATVLWSCKTINITTSVSSKLKEKVEVNINLNEVKTTKFLSALILHP